MARSRSTPTPTSTKRGGPPPYKLKFTVDAGEQYQQLKRERGLLKRLKAVNKALGLLETNPRHQSLQTHKYETLEGPNGEDVFEAYAEQKTPAAYRIFWYYGPERGEIIIVAITRHP